MPRLIDAVQIAATTANVFSGRISASPPPWARKVSVAYHYSDEDAQLSVSIGGREIMRASNPTGGFADNAGRFPEPDEFVWASVTQTDEILVSLTETTSGTGIVYIVYT